MAIDTALKSKSVLLCVVRRLTVSGDEFLASIVVFLKQNIDRDELPFAAPVDTLTPFLVI
jgi:hypothetical protein